MNQPPSFIRFQIWQQNPPSNLRDWVPVTIGRGFDLRIIGYMLLSELPTY